MKAVLRNRAALQQASSAIAEALDELVSAVNTPPLEVGDAKIRSGTLTPEGRLSGNPGDLYLRRDGGTGTTFYVKETGTNTVTGWVAK